jgi:hypothetical protein
MFGRCRSNNSPALVNDYRPGAAGSNIYAKKIHEGRCY